MRDRWALLVPRTTTAPILEYCGKSCKQAVSRLSRFPITPGNARPSVRYCRWQPILALGLDRKSTRLNSSHTVISYAVFCLKKKKNKAKCRTLIGREYEEA